MYRGIALNLWTILCLVLTFVEANVTESSLPSSSSPTTTQSTSSPTEFEYDSTTNPATINTPTELTSSSTELKDDFSPDPKTTNSPSNPSSANRTEFVCSYRGNCTCVSDSQIPMKVTCTSVGDNLDEIAQELPSNTTHLILRKNGMTNLSPSGIMHFLYLEVLDLRDNRLTTLGTRKLQSFLEGLSQLLLDNNPIVCDCRISRSRQLHSITGTCAQPPHLRGVEIGDLLHEDFKCPRSCAELFAHGNRSDGLYSVSPAPLPGGIKPRPIKVWCDMSGIHGGWLVIQQRRITGKVDFSRDWLSYEHGFGGQGQDFWLGNKLIHHLTWSKKRVLRLEIYFTNGTFVFAEYDNFRVASHWSNYTLRVGHHRGNLSNILSAVNNSAFSTWDRDNVLVNDTCAMLKSGGWWYKTNCDVVNFNSNLMNFTKQGIKKVVMKTKPLMMGKGSCGSSTVKARVQCGWPDITEQQCLARDCCYDNRTANESVICFIQPSLVFFQRTGCFAVGEGEISSLEKQDQLLMDQYPSRPNSVNVCGRVARSRGLKGFAVRDGGECLGDTNVHVIYPTLAPSDECAGGRGGQDVADFYKFTVFVTKIHKLITNEITTSSVVVAWDRVPELFILGYRVRVDDGNFDKLIDWKFDHVYIDGLHSNTTYSVWVYPIHGLTDDQSSMKSSLMVIFTTEPAQETGEPPKGTEDPTHEGRTEAEGTVEPETSIDAQGPTDPRGPTDPPGSTDPTEPLKPTDPQGPTDPRGPTNPQGPTKPIVPTEPDGPTELEGTTDSQVTNRNTRTKGPTTNPRGPAKSDGPTATEGPTYTQRPTRPIGPQQTEGTTRTQEPSTAGSTYPYAPTEPERTIEPEERTEKKGPTGAERTTDPERRTEPAETTEPQKPTAPQGPMGPQGPSGPEGPGAGKAPTRAPGSVSARALSSTSLLIRWSHVPEQHLHGQLMGYEISYARADQASSPETLMTTPRTSYELQHLSVFTLYVMEVSAVTFSGVGPKSQPVTARTGESVPSAPPTNVRLDYVGSTAITAEWDPVPKGSRHGKIQGYRVIAMVNGSHQKTGPDEFRTSLKGLKEDTSYGIQVAAFTNAGYGPYSEPIKTRTKEYDPCDNKECLNGGSCLYRDEGQQQAYCICATNFTGALCESLIGEDLCLSPNVSLPNLSPAVLSAVSVLRSRAFLIRSEVQLNCKLSYQTIFKWNVYQINARTERKELRITRTGSSELRISRQSLPVGVYLVRLTVEMVGTPVIGASRGFFRITRGPLIAVIEGGTKVERGYNTTIVLDASISRDPGDRAGDIGKGLSFTWICRNVREQYSDDLLDLSPRTPRVRDPDVDLGGCYGTGPGRIGSNEPVLGINSGLMLENSSYYVTVLVEKDKRRANYTQEVVIVPGDPPEVKISCVDNCDLKMNPSRRIALKSTCSGPTCGGALSYQWSLFKFTGKNPLNGTHWTEVPDLRDLLRTRLTSSRLVTKRRTLTPRAMYRFTLRAKRRGGHPGLSEYKFTTNSPPSGGKCNASPHSGRTLETEFNITCFGWIDTDRPLQYEFIYFTTEKFPRVVYIGRRNKVTTNLPTGERSKNYTVDVRVRVYDVMGAFAEISTPIQVFEPAIKSTELVELATKLTTGNDSQLTSLIQSGDLSRATQLASAVIVAVDEDTKAFPSSEKLLKRVIMIKSSIVKQFSSVRVETVERIQQISDVIAQVTSVMDEVSEEAQDAATEALDRMATVLKEESEEGENYEALLDGAGSLVSGLGNVLRVTSYKARVYGTDSRHEILGQDETKSPSKQRKKRTLGRQVVLVSQVKRQRKRLNKRALDEASVSRIQRKSKKGSLRILRSLDEVGTTILSRTLVGEAPKKLSAKSVSLLLSREEPHLLKGAVLSDGRSSFTLPSAFSVFGNHSQFVDSQMMTTDYTPFTWDVSGARLTTGVTSLVVKNSSGYLMNITQLKSPIIITLPQTYNVMNDTNKTLSHFVRPNRTVFHKVQITQSDLALFLKVRPVNNSVTFHVSLRYDSRPSHSNSDFNTTVPDYSSCAQTSRVYFNCSRDPYTLLISNAHVKRTGYYFIGIQVKSSTKVSPWGPRVKRCSGRGRNERSCVEYKDPPTVAPVPDVPQYGKEDYNYTLEVSPAACLYWSTSEAVWTTRGCRVDPKTNEDNVYCQCDHLTAFGGQLFVVPNPIDFDNVFTELTDLPETGNVAVIIAVGSAFGVYILLLVRARKADRHDRMKVGNKPFLGLMSPSAHRYEVQVSTGVWYNAGTSANVYIILIGEKGRSRAFQLKDDSCILFARGSVTTFSLSLPRSIGDIQSVRVWHDNSGVRPSWFLNHIMVLDVHTHQQWMFGCYKWLSTKRGDSSSVCNIDLFTSDNKRIQDKVSFLESVAEEFSNGHLWFSVATKPPCNRFTRAQRLSCCLLLLSSTMLASAMFYETGASQVRDEGSLRIGRLVLNLRELIIALESQLIVVPINLLVVQMFSRVRPPNEDKQSRRRYTIKRCSKASSLPSNRRCQFTLPHWFIYVAWIICVLGSLVSAVFVIFYSLQWGKETSTEWLVSIFMSMFIDILVSEPFRIVVVALLISHISMAGMYDMDDSSYAGSIYSLSDIEFTDSNQNDNEQDVFIPSSPDSEKLKRVESDLKKEVFVYEALRKIVAYIMYLWILMIISYGGRSKYGYLMTLSVQTTVGELSKISSQQSMLDWAREVLVPGLFDDGKDVGGIGSSPYTGDGDAVLVGMPRLRQLRVKKDSCKLADEVKRLFSLCVASYTSVSEDKTKFYKPKWLLPSASANTTVSDLYNICPRPWQYSSAEEAQSLPFWGWLQSASTYSQGGYLANLGYDKKTALKVISELSLMNWTDRFTSAVLVEYTLFNTRVNLLSSVIIPVEFSPSGHVVSNHVVRTIAVYNLSGGYSILLLICQVLLPLFIIYFVVREAKQMIQEKREYFFQFLNWVELLQILTAIGFIITHVIKEVQLFENTAKLRANIFQFISFDKQVVLDDTEKSFLALLMFFNTLKLLYLVKFNSHVTRLFNVLKDCILDLINCSLVFFLYIFAFTHYGYLQFGRESPDFFTPRNAFQSLMLQGVIDERKEERLQDVHEVLGPLFFVIFNIGLHVIWLNIFTAILIYSYHSVERGRTLCGFIMAKLTELLACFGLKTTAEKKNLRLSSECPKWKTNDYGNKSSSDVKTPTLTLTDKMNRLRYKLNENYVDDFGSDFDLVDLLFAARVRIKDAAEHNFGFDSQIDEDQNVALLFDNDSLT